MRSAKRSCRQYSKNIGDLPDPLLVDILCRLPCESAVQCKSVSKHWFGLISDPYFLRRFLCLQSQKQKPIIRTLIFSNTPNKNNFVSMSSAEPGINNWPDFSFLPCFRSPSVEKDNEPVVLGSYNDLVLCCATKSHQLDYYICNPRTKKWVRLPRSSSQCSSSTFEKVRVGFICEPFYREVAVGEGLFELDFEFTFIVVRLISEKSTAYQFHMEVFNSEKGCWFYSIVYSWQSINFDSLADNIGIAHKGMLYWWSLEGFLIGVKLDVCSSIMYCVSFCTFIEQPRSDDEIGGGFDLLGVCGGRLRLCQLFSEDIETFLRIWELREDHAHKINGDRWCLIATLPIDEIFWKNPSSVELDNDLVLTPDTTKVLAFDPNNEDILFLQMSQHVFMCNIRAKTVALTNATRYESIYGFERSVCPLVLPWWPTPVPTVPCPIGAIMLF